MQPAFRSIWSAGAFCAILLILLGLPVLLAGLLPPRIEVYKSIATGGGYTGKVLAALDRAHGDGDIAFLGSSLIEAGISTDIVAIALSAHLQRPVKVDNLALNWPGLDLQYVMLRDYLSLHQLHLLVWNLPQPQSRAYDAPHIQSYRWLRYGEYSDALATLAFRYRAAIYGEMVIGAPRQLLSKFRENRVGNELSDSGTSLARIGYHGAPYVEDAIDNIGHVSDRYLIPSDSTIFKIVGPAPGPYQLHFARQILELAKEHNCTVVFIHVPTDAEYESAQIPELAAWTLLFGKQYDVIGIPSAVLFRDMQISRFHRFYRNIHFNDNGATAFTTAIVPTLIDAYDRAAAR